MSTTRIEVDFNNRDDAGFVPALLADADGPVRVGDAVELFDDEGDRCIAIVAAVSGPTLAADVLWQTFAAPGESRFVLTSVPDGLWSSWRGRLAVMFQPVARLAPPNVSTGADAAAPRLAGPAALVNADPSGA